MKNIFIATFPFGCVNPEPIHILEKTGWNIEYNPLGRRLKETEVQRFIQYAHGIIAGTESYTAEILSVCNNLQIISRVGIGLDNIDMEFCKKNNIVIKNTPDAPSDSVADMVVSQIINLIRGIFISDKCIRQGQWNRYLGKLISEIKIGILGFGRIGKKVTKRLFAFGADIYVCDINPDTKTGKQYGVKWENKEDLFRICDLVTIHIPMNKENHHCVNFKEMSLMKNGSFVINTSRGSVLNEFALESLIKNNHIRGAALDVFKKEPYEGNLINYSNVILTAHIGASSCFSRYLMELGAVQNCINVISYS